MRKKSICNLSSASQVIDGRPLSLKSSFMTQAFLLATYGSDNHKWSKSVWFIWSVHLCSMNQIKDEPELKTDLLFGGYTFMVLLEHQLQVQVSLYYMSCIVCPAVLCIYQYKTEQHPDYSGYSFFQLSLKARTHNDHQFQLHQGSILISMRRVKLNE